MLNITPNKVSLRVMVVNVTFNNMSAISWWSVLMVEENRVPGETTDLPQVYTVKPMFYCPSIHRQTRVLPRISAVPFSIYNNNPVKMSNSHTATVIKDPMLFKP